MFLTKTALSRRQVLRGAGVTLALPFLEAMVPAATALSATAAVPPKRLAFLYLPNGVIPEAFFPTAVGPTVPFSPTLAPLEPFRRHVSIVSGLANAAGDPLDSGGGPHSRNSGCWLSGQRVTHTERSNISSGKTVDQFAADVLGQQTPIKSLELALEPNFAVGTCEGGYSCAYVNTFVWRTATLPLPMETNPRIVFERLFGDGGDPAWRRTRMRTDRSLLDSVTADLTRLGRTLGPRDRGTLDEYGAAVRDVERRVQQSEARSDDELAPMAAPLGIPEKFADHARLMFDLWVLAYRADLTRVVTFQLARELSQRAYPEIGVADGHHGISHHSDDPNKIAQKAKIDLLHLQLVAYLVGKLAAMPEGDGTLLDHSITLVGGALGDGNLHRPHNLPVVLVGGGNGTLTGGGRHVKVPFDTPFMNLGLTLLEKVGVQQAAIGDSTGRLTEIG